MPAVVFAAVVGARGRASPPRPAPGTTRVGARGHGPDALGAEEIRRLTKVFGEHPDLGRAVRMVSDDEENHLAYSHEELLRLARRGHGGTIRALLREAALVEIRVYRDVSLAVMAHMGAILGWSKAKPGALALAIRAVYLYERAGGWRRMVTLKAPPRPDALGGQPTSAGPEFA